MKTSAHCLSIVQERGIPEKIPTESSQILCGSDNLEEGQKPENKSWPGRVFATASHPLADLLQGFPLGS